MGIDDVEELWKAADKYQLTVLSSMLKDFYQQQATQEQHPATVRKDILYRMGSRFNRC